MRKAVAMALIATGLGFALPAAGETPSPVQPWRQLALGQTRNDKVCHDPRTRQPAAPNTRICYNGTIRMCSGRSGLWVSTQERCSN